MKKLLLLCCAVCVLYVVSCKKEEKRPSMRTEMITEGKWQVTALGSDSKVNKQTTTTDLYVTMPDCMKDNLLTFNMDGSCTTDEGEQKCDPDAPQTYGGVSWKFMTADTQLELTDTSGSIVYDILSLNDTGLVLQYVKEVEDATITTTTKYRHIH